MNGEEKRKDVILVTAEADIEFFTNFHPAKLNGFSLHYNDSYLKQTLEIKL